MSFPIKNVGSFHSFLYVYQRVPHLKSAGILVSLTRSFRSLPPDAVVVNSVAPETWGQGRFRGGGPERLWFFRGGSIPPKMGPKQKTNNVVSTIINHPFGNGLYIFLNLEDDLLLF